jgi:ribosomal protein S20
VAKAQDSLKAAQIQLSRGKGKGLLHGNNAGRKMSRLSAKVAALKKSK